MRCPLDQPNRDTPRIKQTIRILIPSIASSCQIEFSCFLVVSGGNHDALLNCFDHIADENCLLSVHIRVAAYFFCDHDSPIYSLMVYD